MGQYFVTKAVSCILACLLVGFCGVRPGMGQTTITELPHGNLLDTLYSLTWGANLWMSNGRIALFGRYDHNGAEDFLQLYNVIAPDSLDSLGCFGYSDVEDAARTFTGIYMAGDDLVKFGSTKIVGFQDPWEIVTQKKIETLHSISQNRVVWSKRIDFHASASSEPLVTGEIFMTDSLLILDRGSWGFAVASLDSGDSLRILSEQIVPPVEKNRGSISVDGRILVELVNDGDRGVKIYDISDPTTIRQVGSVDNFVITYRQSYVFMHNKLWLLGGDLFCFNLCDPSHPTYERRITPGSLGLDWEYFGTISRCGNYLLIGFAASDWCLVALSPNGDLSVLIRGDGRLMKLFENDGYLTVLREVGNVWDDNKQYLLQWVDARELLAIDAAAVPVTPIAFKLLSNYPNPFNSSTILTLDVPARALYNFELFDTGGRRVLFERREMMLGRNRYSLDGAGLAAGEYLLRASGGRWTGTGRVVVEK